LAIVYEKAIKRLVTENTKNRIIHRKTYRQARRRARRMEDLEGDLEAGMGEVVEGE
jgi:hypothetical protein